MPVATPRCRNNLVCNSIERAGTCHAAISCAIHPHALIEGLAIARLCAPNTHGRYNYIRASSWGNRCPRFEAGARGTAYAAGLLGKNIKGSRASISKLHTYVGSGPYICGEETH